MLIARELRELGIDPPLVYLTENGVSDTGMTLVDELYLIAVQLDYDAAMLISLDPSEPARTQCRGFDAYGIRCTSPDGHDGEHFCAGWDE
jgi:hypothetical protein